MSYIVREDIINYLIDVVDNDHDAWLLVEFLARIDEMPAYELKEGKLYEISL